MAILTSVPNTGKYVPDVTLGARDGSMQAPQGIFRLVVVKFRDGADRYPRIGGVAVLARYVQISVRTVGAPADLRPSSPGSYGKRKKKQYNYTANAIRTEAVERSSPGLGLGLRPA